MLVNSSSILPLNYLKTNSFPLQHKFCCALVVLPMPGMLFSVPSTLFASGQLSPLLNKAKGFCVRRRISSPPHPLQSKRLQNRRGSVEVREQGSISLPRASEGHPHAQKYWAWLTPGLRRSPEILRSVERGKSISSCNAWPPDLPLKSLYFVLWKLYSWSINQIILLVVFIYLSISLCFVFF